MYGRAGCPASGHKRDSPHQKCSDIRPHSVEAHVCALNEHCRPTLSCLNAGLHFYDIPRTICAPNKRCMRVSDFGWWMHASRKIRGNFSLRDSLFPLSHALSALFLQSSGCVRTGSDSWRNNGARNKSTPRLQVLLQASSQSAFQLSITLLLLYRSRVEVFRLGRSTPSVSSICTYKQIYSRVRVGRTLSAAQRWIRQLPAGLVVSKLLHRGSCPSETKRGAFLVHHAFSQ